MLSTASEMKQTFKRANRVSYMLTKNEANEALTNEPRILRSHTNTNEETFCSCVPVVDVLIRQPVNPSILVINCFCRHYQTWVIQPRLSPKIVSGECIFEFRTVYYLLLIALPKWRPYIRRCIVRNNSVFQLDKSSGSSAPG